MSPKPIATDWYDTPKYYDIVFSEDTEEESYFLERVLERYGGGRGNRIFEPACGSGRLVEIMADLGYEVTGFDLNPAMLEYARKRCRESEVDLHEGAMEKFDIGRGFDLGHCLVSSFKYVMTEDGARSHLECVARTLRKGGVYVLGLHLTDYKNTARLRERWVCERKGTHVVCNTQTWPAEQRKRTEQVRTRLRITESGAEKTLETNWTFRTYSAPQLRRLIQSVPALEHVATFDFNYDIDDPIELADGLFDCVVVLRKR